MDGEEWFEISSAEVVDFQQVLDLRAGMLERNVRFRHAQNRITSLVSRRLVHMRIPHLAALEWQLTAENWSGRVEIRSALDGTVCNQGVERYRDLSSRHLEVLEAGRIGEDGISLAVQTNQSHLRMTQAARTHVLADGGYAAVERETWINGAIAEQRLTVDCEQEKPVRIEKVVALHTSRDPAISEPTLAASDSVSRAGSFGELYASHALAWEEIWSRADIQLDDCNSHSQRILRLHVFHLLQTVSPNTVDLDVGVPSRGLHGEAYRGHIFWDELFIFPFLNLRMPELVRSLLMYRYRRLDEARHLAHEAGYLGAMFPWQSGSSGREESEVIHLNPQSGRWIPDNTHRQRHISAAIAFNVWQYFQATGDLEFVSLYGAEMLLEIARFWASIAVWNSQRDRYEIHNVVGPDEFHTQYPDSDSPGLNNNAYTNVMAAWVLRCGTRALDLLAEQHRTELARRLQISDEELRRWDDVSRNMFVSFQDAGIINQFEGYEDLEELDWQGYRERYGDIQRLDRILEAEDDTPNRYKASKQADVLMLFYLFSREELQQLFEHLGYEFDAQTIRRNIDYYLTRTSHGSTLSRVVHSWVLARSDRERAWELFSNALESDVADIQGGTTPEGIHLGAMAGTVDVLQRCYTGIEIRDDVLWLNPYLPSKLTNVRLRVRYRGHWLRLHVSHEYLRVAFEHGWSGPAHIGFRDQIYSFAEGECREFEISR